MFCANCGKNNKDGAKFCLACGNKLEEKVNDELLYEKTHIDYPPMPNAGKAQAAPPVAPPSVVPPVAPPPAPAGYDTFPLNQNNYNNQVNQDYFDQEYNQSDEYAPNSEFESGNSGSNEGTKYWIIVGVLAFVAIVLGAVLGIVLFTSF